MLGTSSSLPTYVLDRPFSISPSLSLYLSSAIDRKTIDKLIKFSCCFVCSCVTLFRNYGHIVSPNSCVCRLSVCVCVCELDVLRLVRWVFGPIVSATIVGPGGSRKQPCCAAGKLALIFAARHTHNTAGGRTRCKGTHTNTHTRCIDVAAPIVVSPGYHVRYIYIYMYLSSYLSPAVQFAPTTRGATTRGATTTAAATNKQLHLHGQQTRLLH